jgi:hypothetical protein
MSDTPADSANQDRTATAMEPQEQSTRITKLESVLQEMVAHLANLTSQGHAIPTTGVQGQDEAHGPGASMQLPTTQTRYEGPGVGQGPHTPLDLNRKHSIPVPLFDPRDPFLTLRRWDIWHVQVTDQVYKNSIGTHSAISILMDGDGNRSVMENGSGALKRLYRIVTSDLLLSRAATIARDDALWSNFKDHFRTCLDVTIKIEERILFDILFKKMRPFGEAVYSFAVEFKLAALNYNQISVAKLREYQIVHWMIQALNLTGYPMRDLRYRLQAEEKKGTTVESVLATIAQFPELSELTKIERQLGSMRSSVGGPTGNKTFAVAVEDTDDHMIYIYSCYGALAMCMIVCAGPPTPSKYRMYHTLVTAPAFLVISTIGPSATVLL